MKPRLDCTRATSVLLRSTITFVLATSLLGTISSSPAQDRPMKIVSPADGATIDGFLTAILRWETPQRAEGAQVDSPGHGYAYAITGWAVNAVVSANADLTHPLFSADLPDHQVEVRLALRPDTRYYWRLLPIDRSKNQRVEHPELAARATFITASPRNEFNAPDEIRYENPRPNAHWHQERPVPLKQIEVLSPWYSIKSYKDLPPPQLDVIRSKLPVPVIDGNPKALEAYWYCWNILLKTWTFAPSDPDHQAVRNLQGIKTWGPWGSTMIFDSCFIMHFARYGAAGYPFINGLDNCYARQHENGFISRETDKNNREVYVIFPVNPPLLAWAEWEWYLATADTDRLKRVLLPLIKHYEWWMRFQRRADGLYWTNGAQEADDSPRNDLMYTSVSASSYQGMIAQYIARIAHEIGREDLASFFREQQADISQMVNANFWDAKHGIYNDLAKDKTPITELKPGSFCKHVHMFWPLMAGFTPPDRLAQMVKELQNPNSFGRRNGVPSLSADSQGYNKETGAYWRGSVWPSAQCMVQEGLKETGQWPVLNTLATKYFNACLEAYDKQKDVTEYISPDSNPAVGHGAGEFVGWGGIGPVANLIEYILGLEINAPEKVIIWRIRRTDRHGIENLTLNNITAALICAARQTADAECHITITNSSPFTLRVQNGNGPVVEKKISAGTQQLAIPTTIRQQE